MEGNYTLLIRKIDEFIRKYYKNQLIRGLLYSLAALGLYFIFIVLLEYFSWFYTTIRSIFFYTYVVTAVVIIGYYIVVPLLRMARLGKLISHNQAAEIIGTHFSDVKDILLNTLQLHELELNTEESTDLIKASIDQRIRQLKPVVFTEAVDLRQNRKYLVYALPPLIFLLAAFFISPSFILLPSKRILNYNRVYERPAPFSVKVLNKQLQTVQQDDFTVHVKIEGDEIPDQLYIHADKVNYRMDKESPVLYSYTFKNLQQSTPFFITADKYNSKEYTIKILPKPIILSFEILAKYPAYLKRESESFINTGDLTVPTGTLLSWKFYTRDTKQVLFRIGGKLEEINSDHSNTYIKAFRMLEGAPYSVILGNDFFTKRDSLSYVISVIPDLYPSISVETYKDSIYDNRLYYQGKLKDDYGFNRLVFAYSTKKAGNLEENVSVKTKEIPLDKTLLQQQFYYFMDMTTLMVNPGDEIEYYFEIWDNDGVSGSKSTRSGKSIFRIPTLDEIEKLTEKKNDDIKDKMESVIKQAQTLQHQVEDMQRKLVDKKEVGWQEKQTLKQMLDKQNSLQNQVLEINKENKEKSLQQNQYMESNPEIMQKQQQLEELFNKVMTEDLKQVYDELQKLLEQIDKTKVAEMLDKIKDDSKILEKELDRNLELFKQLELEQKLQQTIDKLESLSEDQKKLGDETSEAKEANLDKEKGKQDEINKKFDQIKEDLSEIDKKNNELEDPNKLENTDTDEKEIDQDLENSSKELNNGKPQKASKSQKSAAGKMKKLKDGLSKMQAEMDQEEEGEDIEALRQILDNLVKISFNQEDIIGQLNVISANNPKYLSIIQRQKTLKDDLKIVADSLYALSKRQASIEPFILRELTAVDNNMEAAVKQLNDRVVEIAKTKQQYAMTSVNNLALMLSETLKQMQQNMNNSSAGKGKSKSKNPKGGSGKMKSLRQLQEQMNKQLQEMKEGLGKQGQQGSQGKKQMSEKLARMAAQQEALRQQLQQYGQQMQNEGSGVDKNIKEMLQQMEQTETDLVNKRINSETIRRQQEIVSRMLESEKAEQQRELDTKRESNEAKGNLYNNPAKFFEYNKAKEKENELFRTVPPALKPFYKSKVNAYFMSFE